MNWVLLPPIAIALVWLVLALLERAARPLAAKGTPSEGKTKAYACGEDPETNRVQPNYSEFFPVAFFFTIMHVVALMVATVPQGGFGRFVGILALYIIAAASGLFILFGEKIESDLKKLLGGR